jgi:hypothetical protein
MSSAKVSVTSRFSKSAKTSAPLVCHRAEGVPQLLVRRRVVLRVGRGIVERVVADVVEHLRPGLLERAADRLQVLPRLGRHPRDQLADLIVILAVLVEGVEGLDEVARHEAHPVAEVGVVVLAGTEDVAQGALDVVLRHRHRDQEPSVDPVGGEDCAGGGVDHGADLRG